MITARLDATPVPTRLPYELPRAQAPYEAPPRHRR